MTAATGERPAPRHGTRPVLVLRALAASGAPLTTGDLVDLLGEGITSRQQAVTWYGQILCRHERNDRVERVGRTAAGRRAGPSFLWQVTEQGLKWLADKDGGV